MAYRRTQGCSRYAQAPSVHVEIPHEETRPDQSVGLYTATPEVKRTLADRGIRVGCRGRRGSSDVGRVSAFRSQRLSQADTLYLHKKNQEAQHLVPVSELRRRTMHKLLCLSSQ